MKKEKVSFINRRRIRLVGDWYKADSDKGIICCHGFTGDKEEGGLFTLLGKELQKENINCLSIDFSGSGESEDEIQDTNNQAEDLQDTIRYFEEQGMKTIGTVGFSLGPLAILKNKKLFGNKIKIAALWAPVTDKWENYREWRFEDEELESLKKDGYLTMHLKGKRSRHNYKISEQLINEREQLNQQELLADIDLPILIVHGEEDKLVPLKWSKKALKQLPKESKLITIPKAGHTFKGKEEKPVKETVEWIIERL